MSYQLEMPGLAETVAAAPLHDKHAALIAAIRQLTPALAGLRLAATRDEGARLARRKVVTAAGELVHDDHEAWLAEQCAADGGDCARTVQRLRALDYRLTECRLARLYLVHDQGGEQADFAQLTVDGDVEDEVVEWRLLAGRANGWRSPRELRDVPRPGRRMDCAFGFLSLAETPSPIPAPLDVDAAHQQVRRRLALPVRDKRWDEQRNELGDGPRITVRRRRVASPETA